MDIIIGLAIGVVFGFILYGSGVSRDTCIRGAMALQDFHMLKVILTAVGVGMLIVFPLSTFGIINFSVKATYVIGVSLGGLIFGAGMAIAGFCPGTVLAALPGGGKNVWWTLAGGLSGALAYSLIYGFLKPWLVSPMNLGKITLPQVLGTNPVATGLVTGIAILLAVYVLDRLTASRPSLPSLDRMGSSQQAK